MNKIVIIALTLAVSVNISQLVKQPLTDVCKTVQMPLHDKTNFRWVMCEPSIQWFNPDQSRRVCIICSGAK